MAFNIDYAPLRKMKTNKKIWFIAQMMLEIVNQAISITLPIGHLT